MSFTYNVNAILTTPLYQLRRMIGDVKENDPQLQDEEIALTEITAGGSIFARAAECCRMIAAKYAREVDSVQADMRQMFSARMNRYLSMAKMWEQRLDIDPIAGMPSAGGLTVADKNKTRDDGNLVKPAFSRGLFDDRIWGDLDPALPQIPDGP